MNRHSRDVAWRPWATQPEYVVGGWQMAAFCDRLLDPDSLIVPLLRAERRVVVLKRATWVPPAPSLPPEEQEAADKLRKLKQEAATAHEGTRGVARARHKPRPGFQRLSELSNRAVDLLYRQVCALPPPPPHAHTPPCLGLPLPCCLFVTRCVGTGIG